MGGSADSPERTASSTLGHRPPSYESISRLESIATRNSIDSIHSFAGASAGVASSIVTCPLDVVKINLQGRGGLQLWTLDSVSIRRRFQDRGLVGTGRIIWRRRGLRGMYRGLGPTVLAYVPRWAIYFTVYHRSNDVLNRRFGGFILYPIHHRSML